MDLLSFALLTFSSIFILIDPITVTLVFVSLIRDVDRAHQRAIARDAALYALAILLVFAIGGYWILQLFGITLAALRIGGGVLLFLIGLEMTWSITRWVTPTSLQEASEKKSSKSSIAFSGSSCSPLGYSSSSLAFMQRSSPLSRNTMPRYRAARKEQMPPFLGK